MPGTRIRNGSFRVAVGGTTIAVARLILPNLPGVAGQAIGTAIAKTTGPLAMIVAVGATVGAAAGVALEATAVDEAVVPITDKRAER